MKPFLVAMMVVVAALGVGVSRATAAGFRLFPSVWGNAIVSTDTAEAGRALTPPTPENPVYYRGLSLGCRLGSLPGDELPGVPEMNRFVAKILAKQGYVGARPGVDKPSLFIVIQWGYLHAGDGDMLWFLGYNPRDDIAAPVFPGQLGPEVFRRNFRSRTVETILTNASEGNYGIIITAFEFESANTPNPVIYWQTRISLPAQGKSMTEALPAMLAAAGSKIGREAGSSSLVDVDNVRKGRVDFGELQVIDQDAPPTLDSASDARK